MEQLGLEATSKDSFSCGKALEGWIACLVGCQAAQCALGGTQLQGEALETAGRGLDSGRERKAPLGKAGRRQSGMSSAPN